MENLKSSAFRRKHAVVHVSAIGHILPGYRGTYLGYVLSGYCSRQQISGEKMKGTYFRRGTYLRGFTVHFLPLCNLSASFREEKRKKKRDKRV